MLNQGVKRKSSAMYCLQKSLISILVLCAFIIFTASCSTPDEPTPKPNQNAAVKKTEAKEIEAKKEKKAATDNATVNEYAYDAAGKIDPFHPLITIVALTVSKPAGVVQQKPDLPLTPLQRLDLTELILVAVIASGSTTSALIEDSSKNGYIVKEGMFIGKNDGAIKKILPNSIIVEEKIIDPMGNPETKLSTLTIHIKE